MTSGEGTHHSAKVAIAAALITAIATVVGAVITARAGGLPQGILPTTTVTATLTTTATSTVTVTSPATPSDPPPSSTTSAAAVYLDEVEPVEGSLDKASVTWKTATYSRSLTNPLSGCSARGPIDWVIPAGVQRFETEIGVATDAAEPDSRVTFNVYRDGQLASSDTLAVGQHRPVAVELGEAGRLRLESIIDKNRRGNCNTEATAVWGDPRLS